MENNSNILQGESLKRYLYFSEASFEFHKLFNFEYRDERAIAILGATFLETALEHILKEFLPDTKETDDLFKFPQALSNFSNKIDLCYLLGLIDKLIIQDLKRVKSIRNKFAHDLYVTFEDKKVKDWTRELKFHKISMMMEPPAETTGLEIFQVGVNQLLSNLSGCISIARSEKREIKNNFETFYR
jgi:hypothetical protein